MSVSLRGGRQVKIYHYITNHYTHTLTSTSSEPESVRSPVAVMVERSHVTELVECPHDCLIGWCMRFLVG